MCIEIEDLDQKIADVKKVIISALKEEIATMKADIDHLKRQDEAMVKIQKRLEN